MVWYGTRLCGNSEAGSFGCAHCQAVSDVIDELEHRGSLAAASRPVTLTRRPE